MRFWKAFPALLTALAVGFVGCAPEDDVDPVDPVPVVDPVVTPDPITPPPAGDVDAVIVAPAPEPGAGSFTPQPGAGSITPRPGAATDDAPAEEPLLQPEDSTSGGSVNSATGGGSATSPTNSGSVNSASGGSATSPTTPASSGEGAPAEEPLLQPEDAIEETPVP